MRRGGKNIALAAALGLFALLWGGTRLPAQTEPSAGLLFHPPLAAGISAMPRLAASDPASQEINARLAQLDTGVLDEATDCNTDPPNSYYERGVEVMFLGPRYFSIRDETAFYCPGAAHGYFGVTAETFDLVTGKAVNWSDLFPSALLSRETIPWGGREVVQGSQALTDLYLSLAVGLDDECRSAIDSNGGAFDVWPSSADRAIVLSPLGLAYVFQNCLDEVTVPLKMLQSQGFAPELLDALANAKPISRPLPPP